MKKKLVLHVSTRVAVDLPVRRRKGDILKAQRKLEVEAVPVAVARIKNEVIQEGAARREALRQAQSETGKEAVAIQPSVISREVVLEVQQKLRLIRRAVTTIREEAVLQVMAKMTVKPSCRALKGRNCEVVHGKIHRVATEVVRVVHAVHLVHAAGHRLVGKAARSRNANLPVKTELCLLQQQRHILTVD